MSESLLLLGPRPVQCGFFGMPLAFVSRGHTRAAMRNGRLCETEAFAQPRWAWLRIRSRRTESLVAQRPWQAGSETAPKPRRRLAGHLPLCDAFACEGPQFFFESPEQQVGRAHNVLRSSTTVERHDGLAWGMGYGRGRLQSADAQPCAVSVITVRAICPLSKRAVEEAF